MTDTETVLPAQAEKLYLRCVGWGVLTGAATGASPGALLLALAIPNGQPFGLAILGALYGAVVGLLIAVLPSIVLGLLVAGAIRRLHPPPATRQAVQRDLRLIFAGVAGLLAAAVSLAIFVYGDGSESLARSAPFLLAGATSGEAVLWLAAASIGRSWPAGSR